MTDTDTRVEGFANWETFNVGITMNSDSRSSHDHVRALVWEYEQAGMDRYEIGDQLRDYFEQSMPELDGFWSSLLTSGWGRVDWADLADHWADAEWRAEQ